MRSGIGPKEELEKIGVRCLVDSPGVGKNLLDHLVCACDAIVIEAY
jgi:choline dehydrogenase-like flavoprotein